MQFHFPFVVTLHYWLYSLCWTITYPCDAEAEAPIFWPPDGKSRLIEKDPHAGKDWRQEEKRETEGEMVGGISDSMGMSLSNFRELVMDRETWHVTVHGVAKSQEWLSNWTELSYVLLVEVK